MRLSEYLAKNAISTTDFASRIGVTSEAVRLYALGKRTPRREHMSAILEATDGEVTANDFHAAPSSEACA